MVEGFENREMEAWLVGVRETAQAFAVGVKHPMIPAGTESLQAALNNVRNGAAQALRMVEVVRVNAR